MLRKLDKKILYMTLVLVFFGFFVFFSASLSNLKDIDFFLLIFSKQLIAIVLGVIIMFFIATRKNITGNWLRKNSGLIFVGTFLLQVLVLFPYIGLELNGAQRWINLNFITIQPSEIFKYSFIIFFSAIIVTQGDKLKKLVVFLKFIIIPFILIVSFFSYINDYGTLLSIIMASSVILLFFKIKKKFILIPFSMMVVLISVLYFYIPYVHDRLEVYVNPEKANLQSNFYHLNQGFVAIGSGRITGRGVGSSLQKYSGRLPEPIGDSIFAVYSEEFGFIGSVFLILLFLILLFFIFKASQKLKNNFEQMIVIGLGILVIFPAFYNIGSILGVLPLSGMPITFVSKGGSSMFSALLIMGIILALTRKREY